MASNSNTPEAGDFVSWDQFGPNRAGPERGRVVAVTPRGVLEVSAEWRDDPTIARRVFIDPGNVYLHRGARPPSPSPPSPAPPDPAPPAENADCEPARRYVYCRRPRCPECGSADLHTYRSSRTGDSSVTRHARCRACRTKLLIVVE